MKYTICFDFPDVDEPLFAGWYKGAAGWAPTLATATMWDTFEDAERWLKNGYGPSAEYGVVVEVEEVTA